MCSCYDRQQFRQKVASYFEKITKTGFNLDEVYLLQYKVKESKYNPNDALGF